MKSSEAVLFDQVARGVVDIADAHILPRYRQLSDADIMVKSRDELVTAVDRDAEARLLDMLTGLDPHARLVGEEGVEAGTASIDDLDRGRIWLIDPLDGTANFAAGAGPFGVMLALLEEGETRAAWLYDPVARRLSSAVAGQGSFVNGERASIGAASRSRPIASIAGQFMGKAFRDELSAAAVKSMELQPIPRCAAAHYPMLVAGVHDLAIFQRTLPWDHLPGALFLTEAGGAVSRWNGEPYRAGDGGVGIVASNSAALADEVLATMRPLLDRIGANGLG